MALRGLPDGSAAVSSGDGPWVLVHHDPLGSLGAVLYALDRAGVWDRARVVVDADSAGEVALRLTAFEGAPELWSVEGRRLVETPVAPLADAIAVAGPPVRADLGALVRSAGDAASDVEALVDEVRVRHPELLAEPAGDAVAFTLLGLEVARLVPEGGALRFEVGVGEHDQDARRTVVGRRVVAGETRGADLADLAHAVDVVRRHRRADGPPHPLKRLRRSRWLRALVIDDPTRGNLPGDTVLEPVGDLGSTRSLRVDPPAPAVGSGEVVVCSAGVDLGLVTSAAGAWLQAAGPGAPPRLTLAVPPGDDHPFTTTLLARLVAEARARLVTIPFPNAGSSS